MRAESTSSKGLEIPWRNTFKDKPALINRLINVVVARNLFLVHCSSCKNNRLKATTCDLRFHLWIYYNTQSSLMQEIQFLEFMGGSYVPQAFPNYLICLCFIGISTVVYTQHNEIYISCITFPHSTTKDNSCNFVPVIIVWAHWRHTCWNWGNDLF